MSKSLLQTVTAVFEITTVHLTKLLIPNDYITYYTIGQSMPYLRIRE